MPVFNDSKDLQSLMTQVPRDPPPMENIKKPSHHDELVYIYTSGTTGLPKAAVITHSRYIYIASAIHHVADFWNKDVFYSPLPLYHTACGCMAIGQMMIFGSTVIIRKKFSASAFFSDCEKYKATVSNFSSRFLDFLLMMQLNFRLRNTSEKCAAIVSRRPDNKPTHRTSFEWSLAMDCDHRFGLSLLVDSTFHEFASSVSPPQLHLSSHFITSFFFVIQTVQQRATQTSLTLTTLLVLLASCLESFQPFTRYRSSKPILTLANLFEDLMDLDSYANLTNLECLSVS